MKKSSLIALLASLFVLVLVQFLSIPIYALSDSIKPNWLMGMAHYEEGSALSVGEECTVESIVVDGNRSRVYADNAAYINHGDNTEHNACVYHARGYSYAQYQRDYYMVPAYPSSGTLPEYGVAIELAGETTFKYAEGFGTKSSPDQYYFGDTTLFVQHAIDGSDSGLRVYKELPEHLHLGSDGLFTLDDNPEYRYVDANNSQVGVYGLGISINKSWLSFGVRNFGIIILNLNTLQANRVSDRYDVQSWIWPIPQLSSSVSDDGRYVVVGGAAYQTEVITVNGCGSPSPAEGFAYHSQLLDKLSCPYSSLTDLTTSHSPAIGGSGLRALDKLQISPSGNMFTYWDNYKWNTVYAPNHLMPGQLYYLALGDSYASGEGDLTIDGADHYLPGTNIYGNYSDNIARETCHISTRSYPMRIADAMKLVRGPDMQSVACSGAVISDILTSSAKTNGYVDASYMGQSTQLIEKNGPRLSGISNATQLQADAHLNYIPGRVQQIELVKKSQPKYITVMAGGNDVDFAGVMMACAKNVLPSAEDTCEYAQGDGLAGEAKKIHDLYPKLVDFYKALKEVSPSSTIYVLGYPQFMDDDNESCAEMLNLYSKQERQAIHSLITYADAVIRNAALDSDAKYIDISNALTGTNLCASGTSMTGMTDVFTTAIYTEYMKLRTVSDSAFAKTLEALSPSYKKALLGLYLTERAAEITSRISYSPATALADIAEVLSHPNVIGHEAIYNMITQGLGADELDSPSCNEIIACPDGSTAGAPSVTTYFPGLDSNDTTVYVGGKGKVTIGHTDGNGNAVLGALVMSLTGQFVRISSGLIDGTIDPTQPVTVEIHSQPTVLGTMIKVGDEYELQTTLPGDIEVGLHVLHVKGALINGRNFDLDSSVFVEGPLGDIDNDGISDAVDTCAFGRPLNIDLNGNGIDDKCELGVVTATGSSWALYPPAKSIDINANKLNVDAFRGESDRDNDILNANSTNMPSNVEQKMEKELTRAPTLPLRLILLIALLLSTLLLYFWILRLFKARNIK